MSLPYGFSCLDNPAGFARDGAIVAHVPRGARTKKQLLGHLARGLDFPDYFGGNWDALEECLRDLSWLAGAKQVVVAHEDLPLGDGPSRATYLKLLANVCSHWRDEGGLEFEVVFNSQDRKAVGLSV